MHYNQSIDVHPREYIYTRAANPTHLHGKPCNSCTHTTSDLYRSELNAYTFT